MDYFKVQYNDANRYSQYPIIIYYKGKFPHFIRFYLRNSDFHYTRECLDCMTGEMERITKEEWNIALQNIIQILHLEIKRVD